MDAIPRGKIGHLPPTLREEVNRRMERGEPGATLLAWLNALPEVQALLAAEFKGQPVTKQNLSLWRKFGFKDWLRRREAQAMAAEIGQLPLDPTTPVAAQLATWGSVRYLMAVRELVRNQAGGVSHLDTIRQFTRDVIALRRADHRAARLQFQKEQSEIYDQHNQIKNETAPSRQ